MEHWTFEQMEDMQRNGKIPTTAWVTKDGGEPVPALLRSVTARKSPTERIVVYTTAAAHFAAVPVEDVQEGRVRFYPEKPEEGTP